MRGLCLVERFCLVHVTAADVETSSAIMSCATSTGMLAPLISVPAFVHYAAVLIVMSRGHFSVFDTTSIF